MKNEIVGHERPTAKQLLDKRDHEILVKRLREATGHSMLDCSKAMKMFDNDYQKALTHLNEQSRTQA